MIARLKAATARLTAMVFGRFTPRTWRWGPASDHYQGRRVDLESSDIISATILWMARNFPEAPLQVLRRSGTELTPIPDHRLLQVWRQPNPFYSGVLLWMAVIASWMLHGNAYILKMRSGAGLVVQLWWVPNHLIEPHAPQDDPTVFIDYYEYNPDGRSVPIQLDPADVIHFRYGLDPANPRKGRSPFYASFREVFTDQEAADYTAAILHNLGIPGVVITPDEDGAGIEAGEADQIKGEFSRKFTGDRRGEPLVISSKTKITTLSFSPDQMNLRELRQVPEERITAQTGVPAIVVGLGAGLARSTFANMAEAREAAFENGIIPTQRLMAEDLRVQFLSDFGDITRMEIGFDLSKVRVLQDDQNALTERLTRSLMAGGMLLNTYLRETGQKEIGAAGDVLYVPNTISPMPPSELLATPDMGTQAQNGAANQNGANGANGAQDGQQPAGGSQNGKDLLDWPAFQHAEPAAKRHMRIEYEDGRAVGLVEEA